MRRSSWIVSRLVPALCLVLAGLSFSASSRAQVRDDARQAGRAAQSFPAADEDYFHDMDGGIKLSPDEVRGRDMWLVWTGGDDRLWDRLTNLTFGAFDLLKILSSYPGLKYSRDNRWEYLGLVNEPCFTKATGPDPKHYGLWLDQRDPNCPPDPFANAQKYPGVEVGARGKNMPVGSYYGEPTGIVGLRLFPNPAFDEAAAKRWDPQRYYNDPAYYLSKDLVRPYRVGMSCGFCHVSANPVKPPADPETPQWANLSSNAGAQYFWVDRILAWNADPSNFSVPGVAHGAARLARHLAGLDRQHQQSAHDERDLRSVAAAANWPERWGHETLGPDNLANKQFNDFVSSGPLTQLFQPPDTVWTPHVLKDGSDSVGALGALNRVYLNIGLYSEEWLRHFNPILGGKTVTPIADHDGAGELVLLAGDRGADPGHGAVPVEGVLSAQARERAGRQRLSERPAGHGAAGQARLCRQLRDVPFEQGARATGQCRSRRLHRPALSRMLEPLLGVDPYRRFPRQDAPDGPGRAISSTTITLSNDARVPVTLLQTNACSPLATNAIAGNIWDNFSSASYKSLPSVGAITVYDPFTGKPQPYTDAGRRARLYPRPVIGQHVGDRPLSLQQQRRQVRREPVGRGAHDLVPELDRPDAVARQARQGPGVRRQDAGGDRPHHGDELAAHPDRLSARRDQAFAAAAGPRSCRCSTRRASRSARSQRARRSICWPISTRCRPRRGWPSGWRTTNK